ncbi:MAG: MBL fold metallo-hydrolase [Promethearchaeota archaeon]
MTDKIVMLGTSGAVPTERANLPAVLVLFRGKQFLFDCGEDVQRQFVKCGAGLNKPLKIFISHAHADHVIGLPGLLFRFGFSGRSKLVELFGPPGLIQYFTCHESTVGLNPPFPLHIVEIHHDREKLVHYHRKRRLEVKIEETPIRDGVVYESKEFLVKYVLGVHNIPNFIFGLFQKPVKGKFHPEVAKQLGIPEGYLWKRMHEGRVIEIDGEVIDPLERGVVGQPRQGKAIIYSGDTRPVPELYSNLLEGLQLAVPYVKVDFIVQEAMFTSANADQALEKGHTTAVEAAELVKVLCEKFEVGTLILTHISSRYKDTSEIAAEAKSVKIPARIVVAEDLAEYPLS